MNLNNTAVTISSREIAELTGKHHAHVMASIRRTFAEQGITDTGLATYIDRQGKPRPCYQLTPDHALITFPSRCVTLMAALVKRIEELQEAAAKPQISTFADEFTAALLEGKQLASRAAIEAPLKSRTNPHLTATNHDVAKASGLTDVQAWHATDELLAELTEAGVIKEGEDWEWDQEQDSFFMTPALKWTVLTGLCPTTRYLHTLSYIDTIVEGQAAAAVVEAEDQDQATVASDVRTLDTPELFAFSHEIAAHFDVPHKVIKRDIRKMADVYGYCLCDNSYTYEDAKGRERFGYMLDKELLLNLMTGYDVGRIVSDLMQPVVWEDVPCHSLPH